jgi:hypothetical protein
MSRVLIVSYYFPPFNGPGAQHPDFFHRYLREQGFDISTITSAVYFTPNAAPAAAPPEIPDVLHLPRQSWLRAVCQRLYKAEMQVQVRMGRWQPGFVWGKLFASTAAERLLIDHPPDAMISVSPPVSSHWVALRLKKQFPKLFWIADFQDPFIGNPFDSRITDRDRRFEQDVFLHADILSANTDTTLAMWLERHPEYAKKITVTWGGYDPAEEVRALPLASPKPVLSHVGFGARIPTALLKSLARLTESGRLKPHDLTADFVGDLDFGPLAELARSLEAKGVIRVRSTYVPRPEALRISGQAQLLPAARHHTRQRCFAGSGQAIRSGAHWPPYLGFHGREFPVLAHSGAVGNLSCPPEARRV